jgi:hypothetical protein
VSDDELRTKIVADHKREYGDNINVPDEWVELLLPRYRKAAELDTALSEIKAELLKPGARVIKWIERWL